MYSAVLMMALAGAGESPDCHLFHRCCGCSGYVGCCGCSGYYGGGYGYGCGGCYGGCYGCSGCYGAGCFGYCSGSLGYYGTTIYPSNMGPMNPVPGNPPLKQVLPGGAPNPPDIPLPNQTRVPATIQVNLPSEAVVYFDGFRTTVARNRTFTTPGLDQGKTYFYTVKVEMNHEGQTLSTTERVLVRAGQQAQVSFNVSTSGSMLVRQD